MMTKTKTSSKMLAFLSENTPAVTLIAAGLLILTGFSALNGCSLRGLMKVGVPPGPRVALHIGPKISLEDAPLVYQDWMDWCRRNSEQFAANIQQSEEILGFFAGLTNMGFEALSESPWAATGVGGLLMMGLGFLPGLMFNRPGAKSRENEAEARGREEGRKVVLDAALTKGIESLRT